MRKWMFGRKTESAIGMEIKDTVIKLVEVEKTGNQIQLTNFHIEPLPAGVISTGKIEDGEKFSEVLFLMKNKAGLQAKHVHVSINCQHILLRPLIVPNLPEKEVEKAINLEIENNIQIPFDDYVSDYAIITDLKERKTAKELSVMLVIAPKSYVYSYINPLKEINLLPLSVDLAPLAVQRSLELNQAWTMDQTYMIVNISEKNTEVSIVHNQVLRMVRTFALDIAPYLEPNQEDIMGAVSGIRSFSSDIGSELERIINFYLYTLNNRDQTISQLILVGDIKDLPTVAEYLSVRLNVPVVVEGIKDDYVNPHLIPSLQEVAPSLVVPFGLAIKEVK